MHGPEPTAATRSYYKLEAADLQDLGASANLAVIARELAALRARENLTGEQKLLVRYNGFKAILEKQYGQIMGSAEVYGQFTLEPCAAGGVYMGFQEI